MDKYYSFSTLNDNAYKGISNALNDYSKQNSYIVLCIGSDLVLADSLGPLVGTFLKKENPNFHFYGTLTSPITAKEIPCVKKHLSKLHPNAKIIAIDAAVGNESEIGLIKVFNKGFKPGLGVNKNLGEIGDVSIIGIVASKSINNYELYNNTRLNLVYEMAKTITNGITDFVNSASSKTINFSKGA